MCGIAGIWSLDRPVAETASRMAACLVHRGPDDDGLFVDERAGVGLAFRRLAIIDLSPAGHQPMQSASGRFTVIFNGEVYNFEDLRRELQNAGRAPAWRGHSDTEVLLAAFEAWGVHDAVPKFNGMFAMAVWDAIERRLHLIRDRMGVKPLYYARAGSAFVFGSELKALASYEGFPRAIHRGALALYTRLGYVPAPYSIYEAARKVMPGTIITLSGDAGAQMTESVYWSVDGAARRGIADPFKGSEDAAVEILHDLTRDAVALRMIADVPLGVFLSGGIDSSIVAALMQAQSKTPVRTFSIGFREAAYDEATFARAVAAHLGTDHTELYVTPEEAREVIPALPAMYDEPFADSSQIPTHLVSRLARRHVTVSLSGDGGDELFGGYSRYFLGQKLLQKIEAIPQALRPIASGTLRALPSRLLDELFSPGRRWVPANVRRHRAGERLHHLAKAMVSDDLDALYTGVISIWNVPIVSAPPLPTILDRPETWPPLTDPIERMMFLDQVTYLPGDILMKVDHASMAVSLESREPLLDHRLVEFSWRLPLEMKIREGRGKIVLRRFLERYVPSHLIDRPKMGFGVPLDRWLCGPLRDWAESLLDPRRMREEGFLDVASVRRVWDDHLAGRGRWDQQIWVVLMFQAWLDQERDHQLLRVSA